jgi:hypothetical protein
MARPSVIIAGHGPSLLSQRRGSEIDSFDYVIRQKRCQDTLRYPDIYGARKDAVCGSWTIAPELPAVGAGEVWVFMDSRHQAVSNEAAEDAQRRIPCRIDRELCDTWNRLYRLRRTPYQRPKGTQEFDPLGHPHLSAGFHTLLYACRFLNPAKVTLAGFDNIETGGFTWSVTRGPEYNRYPDHRWDIEHEMLLDVSQDFDTEIAFI